MLRNFFRKKKIQEPKIEPEKVDPNEIKNWLDKKIKKFTEKENEVFISIEEKIDSFTLDVGKKIEILEAIDIESKKVEIRAKIIVRQSLDKYLRFVKIFTKELTDIEKQNLNQFIKNTSKIFSDFDKRSYIFYQRANYLIGDELLALKQEINNLSAYFTELFNKNKKIVNSFDIIVSTKLKLTRLDENTTILSEMRSETNFLNKKTIENEMKERNVLDKIEKIRINEDYLENQNKKDKIKLIEKQLENDTSKLRLLIDFKKLTNAFHSDENKMKKIKDYKEDFQKTFAGNNGEDILKLMSEARLDDNSVLDKIKQIDEKKSKICEDKKLVKKDGVDELLEEAEKIKSELENLAIEKAKHIRRIEKIKENEEIILKSIAPDMAELGGVLSC